MLWAQVVMLAVGLVGTAVTLALTPGARSVSWPSGRIALEVLSLCAVLFAAVILCLPTERDVRPARSAFVSGLAALAMSNAVVTVWPVISGSPLPLDQGVAYYPWLVARYVTGLLFIAAGVERPRFRLPVYVLSAVMLILLLDLALLALSDHLVVPVGVVGEGASARVEVTAPVLNNLLQAAPAGLFGVGAMLAGRLHTRSGSPAYAWLSLSLITQVFAQVHEAIAPAFLGPVLSTADAYRLLAVLLLLVAAVHQLGYLYRNRSATVRAQQQELRTRDDLVAAFRAFAEREHDFRTLVSHELATPVATIRAFARVVGIELPPSASDRMRQAVAGIDAESRRLLELVDRMDELRDLELTAFTCDLRPVMVRPILQDAAVFLRGVPGAHPVVLRTTDARVLGDPLRLGQALRNMLSNAVQHSPPGGTISIEARHHGKDRLAVSVSDQGPGIPAAEHQRVLRRYGRGSTVPDEGHGLGLYVTARIAEAHGGAIRIDTSPEGGARVSLDLRLAP